MYAEGAAVLTLEDVVQAGGGVGVSPTSNAVQLLLQTPSVSQQAHLQLRDCHAVICMTALVCSDCIRFTCAAYAPYVPS